MKKNFSILLFIISFINSSFCQNKGVRFEENQSWKQIVEKAKKEGKGIFVDCYATWCIPCKAMDEQVFPDSTIGHYMNDNYVCVKYQMDTTKNDPAFIKEQYPDAHAILTEGDIQAYPSLLYFNPEGKLVHKVIGFQNPGDFLKDGADARDPDRQEYTMLEKFNKGVLADHKVPVLISLLENSDRSKEGETVAHKYIQDYILQLPPELLFKPYNLKLIGTFLHNSDDPTFGLFWKNQAKIDSIAGPQYSNGVIWEVINREEINPYIWTDTKHKIPVIKEPDWDDIYDRIQQKYNAYFAKEAVIFGKLNYYKKTKEPLKLVGPTVQEIELYHIDASGHIKQESLNHVNGSVYDVIFKNSNDQALLEKAGKWMQDIIKQSPNDPYFLDTYANILYKLGNSEQAIDIEEEAIKNDANADSSDQKLFSENLSTMKAGKPTWEK